MLIEAGKATKPKLPVPPVPTLTVTGRVSVPVPDPGVRITPPWHVFPFDNKEGLMVTFMKADEPDWTTNAEEGVSVSQPAPQLFVKTVGVRVTAPPVVLEMVTWVVWFADPAVALNVSDGGLAVTPDI